MPGDCPVTHQCTKCKATNTRPKGQGEPVMKICALCGLRILRCRMPDGACIAHGWLHAATRLHRCGRRGFFLAWPR